MNILFADVKAQITLKKCAQIFEIDFAIFDIFHKFCNLFYFLQNFDFSEDFLAFRDVLQFH